MLAFITAMDIDAVFYRCTNMDATIIMQNSHNLNQETV